MTSAITFLDGQRMTAFLFSIIALFLASPFLEASHAGDRALTGLFTLVLVTGVLAASRQKWVRAVCVGLALPWLFLAWGGPSGGVVLLGDALLLTLLAVVLSVILVRVLGQGAVDADTIAGAIAAYFLVAVFWTVAGMMIEAMVPGSFSIADRPPQVQWMDLLYFNLVTLTTLGYGDVLPVTPLARIWSALEAAFGTLYLTVLIARLVSLYKARA